MYKKKKQKRCAEMIFRLELHVNNYLHSHAIMELILKDHAMYYVGGCLFQLIVNCSEIFLNHSLVILIFPAIFSLVCIP